MKKKSNLVRSIVVLSVLAFFLNAGYLFAGEYTMGIVPQQPPKKIAAKWTPILKYLSAKTGEKIILKTAPSIPEFEKRLAAGDYDIVYTNPLQYVKYHDALGYTAFSRHKDKRLKGIVVVKKDSPIQDIKELDGAKMAFPSANAFAASIVPRANFKSKGITVTPKYVKSHDSVYQTVAKGLYVAGVGVGRTFKSMDKKVTDNLRILWTTEGYTPHAFAAHPRVPSSVVDKITDALMAMNDDPQAEPLMKAIKFKAFQRVKNADWDDVRALKID
ncbi:phosphate/phosphite/phosphonate ABC transporter substrate-binding protein [Thermodesulfobacteriota bacterium]